MTRSTLTLTAIWLSLATEPARADDSYVYARCYAQIAGSVVRYNNTTLAAVKSGEKKATDECMGLLEAAAVNPDTGRFLNDTPLARLVFSNMHRVHHTFFSVSDYPSISGPAFWWTRMNFFDSTAPALYLSRALFNSQVPISAMFAGTDEITPIRSDMNPFLSPQGSQMGGQFGDPPGPMTIFTSGRFAPVGTLLGVTSTTERPVTYTYSETGSSGSLNLSANFGGGILGSWAYLMQNAPDFEETEIDGAEKLPRGWGKSVYQDFLCKDLPAIRYADGNKYVVAPENQTAATAGFRRSASCVACHASMDQTTNAIRNIHYHNDGRRNGRPYGFRFPAHTAPALPAESGWVSTPDLNYRMRPPNGRLLFRNYKGDLVDVPFSGLAELGSALQAQDDFYICMTKRYFDYFTGHDVFINEVFGTSLTGDQLDARNFVIELGLELKQDGDADKVLRKIFDSKFYRRSP